VKTTAAVLVATGRPLEVLDLDVPALQPGQVLVEVAFSGVCHTQVLECGGHRGRDAYLPHCLGHEGSGVVREAGPGVVKVKPGDRVVLSWIKGSGADVPATRYRHNGGTVNAGAVTTFNRFAVVSENRLTALRADVPLREAALLGCAIPTGFGAVLNTASPRPGQSLAVFGVGGVGLCAVAGAAVAGCNPIIAIDLNDAKLALARKLGATHTVLAGDGVNEQLGGLVPGGLDFAIEATGRPVVMNQALACVRPRGGTAVVIGNARFGETLEIDPRQLNMGKRLLGTWGGDCVPDRDYPRFAGYLSTRRIDPRPLLSAGYTLDTINAAINDLAAGLVARPIVQLQPA